MTAAVVLASVAFWAPFNFTVVGDDAKPETIKGRARFKRLKTSERRKLDARLSANGLDVGIRKSYRDRLDDPVNKLSPKVRATLEASLAAEPIDDTEFLREMLVDWELKDKRGESIPYSLSKVVEICEDWDGFDAALVNSYFNARREALDPKAAEKNSEGPSGTGT